MVQGSVYKDKQVEPENPPVENSSPPEELRHNLTMASQNDETPSGTLDMGTAPLLPQMAFSHTEKCRHTLHPGSPMSVLRYCPPCVIKEDLLNFERTKLVFDEHIEDQKTKDNELGRIRARLRQQRVALANDVIKFEHWASYETTWEKKNPNIDVSDCHSSSAALKLAQVAADAADARTPDMEPVKDGVAKRKSRKKPKLTFNPSQQHRPESQYRPQAYWARNSPKYEPGPYSNPTGKGWENTSFMHDLGYYDRERKLSCGEKNASRRKKIDHFPGFGPSDLDFTNQSENDEAFSNTSNLDDEIEEDSESDAGSDSEDIETIIKRTSDQDTLLDDIVFETPDDDSYNAVDRHPNPLNPFHSYSFSRNWDEPSIRDMDEKEKVQKISYQENHLPSLNGPFFAFPRSGNCIIATATIAIPLTIPKARTAQEPLQALESSILTMLAKLRNPPPSAFFMSGYMKRKWLHKVSHDQFDSEGRMKRDCIFLAYQNKLDSLGITKEYWDWLSVKNIDDCTVSRPRQEWFS
ncbi:hypothetical protein AOQ84DRAFT_202842 [Glonium stellatum]|uniref:Uncharacterized protein n=1 Tax=Glonium stellatum TaxID=574774 RepID=A0A8E2JVC4_9PEZI|nr:hypothetical protein AOQ84DRAFT_202842 [Glonium stellatum]